MSTGQDPDPAKETAIVPVDPSPGMAVQLWGSDDPTLMTQRMGAIANAMNAVIEARNLYTTIGGRKHVNIEGWSLVGSMVGVFPHTESVDVMETGHLDELVVQKTGRGGSTYEKTYPAFDGVIAYVATVNLKTSDGGTAGRGSAMCSRREESWRDRDDNQIASMAQTRAAAKAYRLSFGYVMPMAGGEYSSTPAEEMEGIQPERRGGNGGARPAAAGPAGGASNVAAPKRPITNLGGLLQYAAHAYGKQPTDVAAAFNRAVIGDIAKMVTDEHGGDWERGVGIMDTGWGPGAEASEQPTTEEDGEFTEVEPETPEPAAEPETPAEATEGGPDYVAAAADASAASDEVLARERGVGADGAE